MENRKLQQSFRPNFYDNSSTFSYYKSCCLNPGTYYLTVETKSTKSDNDNRGSFSAHGEEKSFSIVIQGKKYCDDDDKNTINDHHYNFEYFDCGEVHIKGKMINISFKFVLYGTLCYHTYEIALIC